VGLKVRFGDADRDVQGRCIGPQRERILQQASECPPITLEPENDDIEGDGCRVSYLAQPRSDQVERDRNLAVKLPL
jgi:hypothetical protein